MKFQRFGCLLLLLCCSTATAVTGQPNTTLRFESDILPIFETRCLTCHGDADHQSDLDLRTRDSILRGGRTGPAVTPFLPDESLLLQKVVQGAMPPGKRKLAPEEIDLLRHWIDGGALIQGEEPTPSAAHAGSEEVTETEVMVGIVNFKCIGCHGRRKQEAGLDLRSRESILRGGVSGPAMVPDRPDQSLLIQRISAAEMPPKELVEKAKLIPVTAAELETLRRWIAAGAPPGAPEIPVIPSTDPLVNASDREFWSFRSPIRPAVPAVRQRDLVRTPIDAFLLEKLEKKQLSYSPQADRLTLLRRAYLALIGLPPSAEDIKSYLNDPSTDAYPRMIDRLLASTHYGEHWGRFWLDAAGYSDSAGKLDVDLVRPFAYRYRDYVIRSFNDDKPYDRFLLEQIAGDELFDYKVAKELTPEQFDNLVATGFLRMCQDGFTQYIQDRFDMLAEQLEVVSSSVLGLTLGCARCHDHKYDPIPQRDYYRFSAIFREAYDLYDWIEPAKRQLELAPEEERREVSLHNRPILAEIERLEQLLKQEDDSSKQEDREGASPSPNSRLGEIQSKIDATRKELRPSPKILALYDLGGEPDPTFVHLRGNALAPDQRVSPGVPSVLSGSLSPYEVKPPRKGNQTSGRRLAFARWLVQPNHPLTARVIVNRIWQDHFGVGLVRTSDNFGLTGARPSHPELLDWLATEFVRQGWSIKAMHRLIMTSAVYRQSSDHDATRRLADSDNVLLSHFPMRRMDAETLRDSILKVGARLDRRQFGTADAVEVRPDGEVVSESLRRSIYLLRRRSTPVTLLEVFDAPRLETNCILRRQSNVPSQALVLWNGDLVRESARFFAGRIIEVVGDDREEQIKRIYLTALTRDPSTQELGDAVQSLEQMRRSWLDHLEKVPPAEPKHTRAEWLALSTLCHVILNSAEFAYVN